MTMLSESTEIYRQIQTGTNYFKFLRDMPRTNEWLTYKEIAFRMERHPSSVSTMLVDLRKRGAVETNHETYPKKYRMSDRGIEALIEAGEL